MCVVAHDVTERKRAEDMLRRSLDSLLALYEASQVLSSTLEAEEIGSSLLRIMQRLSNLTTALLSTPDEHQQVHVWREIGLDSLPSRLRYTPEVQRVLREVLETGEHRLFWLERPGEDADPLVGLCLPLRIKNRSIGLLEVYGTETLLEEDTVDILASMTSQAASALENAQLYGELAERERRLQELVGQLLTAQEEERRRVAYEVHDSVAQVAGAAHQRLQTFARRYPPVSEKSSEDLERVIRLTGQTVKEARQVIAALRPAALDDFGLSVALYQEIEELRSDGWRVDYEENLGESRLPAAVEVTLFRVAQEALTNARKHGQTRRARVELRHQKNVVNLEVQDWGRGFDPEALEKGDGPGERIGLSGMRERITMIGGEFEISSSVGEGTSVRASVPLSDGLEED
jgi:signal transduction histidine kinase